MRKLTTEDKIKKLMKKMSALVEQYYKEHEDKDHDAKETNLRHYASYVHGVSYFIDDNNTIVTDRITFNTVDRGYHTIDITYRREGRRLFDTMTGGNK